MNRRIALFGGSFNPPHMGHLFVCNYLLHVEDFDELWIIPTYHHAFEKELISFEHRVNMCKIMAHIADGNFGSPPDYHGKVQVLEIEKELAYDGKENRTVDTVNRLKEIYQDDFTVIIGSDCVNKLHTWKGFEKAYTHASMLPDKCTTTPTLIPKRFPFKVFIMLRNCLCNYETCEDLPYSGLRIPNASSTQIRRDICYTSEINKVLKMMPKKVADYVLEHNLYAKENT